jgi:glycosyltransferase involved in cell wall biosynthesis
LDVEDIFEYAALNPRLSGIQRVQLELCRALVALDPEGERVGFLRHRPGGAGFRVIGWDSIVALADQLDSAVSKVPSAKEAAAAGAAVRPPDWKPGLLRRGFRHMILRMRSRPRHYFVMSIVHQRAALVSLRDYLRDPWGRQEDPLVASGQEAPDAPPSGPDFAAVARPGDIVATLGAIWYHPDYPGLIRRSCESLGVRFGVLIHDIIPLRRPEWVDEGNARTFHHWFVEIIELADQVLSVSRATGRDVERYAAQHGLRLRGPVQAIPMGTGFSGGVTARPAPDAAAAHAAADARALPEPGSYALMVSTVEGRKNHLLLFHVWRRLVDELPPERIPTLVFAGHVGWMVDDLMLQLRRCNYLDGKIALVRDPTDAELRRLYEGCQFTLYPSFYEGWGLPVSESLVFGRPCIIANATSLPEAGGDLARYFDPYCANDAYEVIRRTIADPADLAAWRERVRREFRPTPWTETAAAVLRYLRAG